MTKIISGKQLEHAVPLLKLLAETAEIHPNEDGIVDEIHPKGGRVSVRGFGAPHAEGEPRGDFPVYADVETRGWFGGTKKDNITIGRGEHAIIVWPPQFNSGEISDFVKEITVGGDVQHVHSKKHQPRKGRNVTEHGLDQYEITALDLDNPALRPPEVNRKELAARLHGAEEKIAKEFKIWEDMINDPANARIMENSGDVRESNKDPYRIADRLRRDLEVLRETIGAVDDPNQSSAGNAYGRLGETITSRTGKLKYHGLGNAHLSILARSSDSEDKERMGALREACEGSVTRLEAVFTECKDDLKTATHMAAYQYASHNSLGHPPEYGHDTTAGHGDKISGRGKGGRGKGA